MFSRQFILVVLICGFYTLNSTGVCGQNTNAKNVKIGLLIADKNDTQARDAINLAFDQINSTGSSSTPKFELLVRHTEGPWGVGSKEAVNFIYEDKVSAIISSLDGRTAHLAEQVCAKAHFIQISTWATDPTLSQAYVPWFFRVIPNDNQQGEVLANEVFNTYDSEDILVITDEEYDSRLAAKSFFAAFKKNGKKPPLKCQYITNTNSPQLTTKLDSIKAKAIVLFLKPETTHEVINQIEKHNQNIPIYANISTYSKLNQTRYLNPLYTITTQLSKTNYLLEFKTTFEAMYGYTPNYKAFFAYDGARILSSAINQAGTDSDNLKTILLKINYSDGISGTIQFDKRGNRVGSYAIIRLY